MTAKKSSHQSSRVQTVVSAEASVKKAAPEKKAEAVMTAPVKYLRRDVKKCSACGTDHKRVLFILRDGWERMEHPYAAKCPVSGKQVLLKLTRPA